MMMMIIMIMIMLMSAIERYWSLIRACNAAGDANGAVISSAADVVYLDAKTDTYLEEVSSCNIFVRKGKTVKTPALAGTILPGMVTAVF